MELGKIKIENRTQFPLEIVGEVGVASDQSLLGITLVIRNSDGSEARQQPIIGRLTGIQMRGIAALDQLEAMMQYRLAPLIKHMAESEPEELTRFLHTELENSPDDLLKAIMAMALFSYRELIDRGLTPPHQEPNDGDLPDTNDND